MHRLGRTAWMIAAAALFAVPLNAVAQPNMDETPYGGEHDWTDRGALGTFKVTVDFPGGTLREYVTSLRHASPNSTANIVVEPSAADLPVGPVTLTEVPIGVAVNALSIAASLGQNGQWVISPLGLDAYGIEVHRFAAPTGAGGTSRSAAEPLQQVFSVRDLLKAPPGSPGDAMVIDLEDLLGALETAFESQGEPRPSIRFHPETGVILFTGTRAQHGTAEQLLATLRRDVESQRQRAEQVYREVASLVRERTEVRVRLELAERRLTINRHQEERIQVLVEAGTAPEAELEAVQLAVAEQESEVMLQADRAKRLSEQIDVLGGSSVPADKDEIRARIRSLEQELTRLRSLLGER